ncbi:unnamed protein product [Zymoseptoria tritici ST99CH_3D7]|uniref:Pre-mRNA-splicing factor CWC26 n=1 Tax=Zymoseptoria tritici (strain ST99CH_3D7) TaxID=1276538 RepID=A0A1X7RJE7_ZYMT9|nr:unnamed protein product [Zymoseptoria tritici ST99CH_3D7]
MPLADYLAQHYLSASGPAPAKKRKRKTPKDTSGGLTIADDDVDTWTQPKATNDSDDDEDTPTIVGGLTIPAAKAKKAKWITVGSSAPKDSEQAAADAILASAAKEVEARAEQDDDAPATVVEGGDSTNAAPAMASGAAAGLQSAAQVSAAVKRKQDAEMAAMKDAGLDMGGLAQQTIYRDASGRRINVAVKKAEVEDKAAEAERKRKEEEEGAKGDVQRRMAEERRVELREAKGMKVARGVDDEVMNEELKGRSRWGDVMAGMLTEKSQVGNKVKGGKARKGKEYAGAFEPNRYGIRPGWRWDGVDRGNGFERKWFAARNRKKDREALEYAWQMDE